MEKITWTQFTILAVGIACQAGAADAHRYGAQGPLAHGRAHSLTLATLVAGDFVIKSPSPLNVLKDTNDHSYYWSR